jgi:curli biogenesis system outer membrane secretion channel CsgG
MRQVYLIACKNIRGHVVKKSMIVRFGIALMLTALSWLAAAQQPNFGEVEFVEENATGYGPTKDIALLDALDNAISAVNGRRVTSVTASMQSAIAVEYEGVSLGQIDTSAYMDAVVSSSQGAVSSYQIIEAIEVVSASNDSVAPSNDQVYEATDSQWKVSVSALVARFNAGPDTGKPTLVVAIPRTSSSTFTLGDSNFQSTQVSKSLQTQLIDMLSQTDRFEILGRDFDEELQSEINFINSDRARSQDIVRLGQQFSADLILVTEIEQLEFLKSSRKLRTSDRELISYQGGGRIVARLMNAATGVLVASESFSIEIEPLEPSTMPRSVNGRQIADDVTSSMSGEVGAMIVRRVFPISVIDLSGTQVILSQGGDMIDVGERYEAVILGSPNRSFLRARRNSMLCY